MKTLLLKILCFFGASILFLWVSGACSQVNISLEPTTLEQHHDDIEKIDELAAHERDASNFDSNNILETPCEELRSRWYEFAQKNKMCDKDSDCFITGSYTKHGDEYCGERCGLTGINGDALSSKAGLHIAKMAGMYVERLKQCIYGKNCFPHQSAYSQASCIEGVCEPTQRYHCAWP